MIYVGETSSEKRVYVAESSQLVSLFFDIYKIPRRCTVLSDNGNAFLDNGDDIFLKLGFSQHHQYPAVVHHFLSPNDNRHHGAAKKSGGI